MPLYPLLMGQSPPVVTAADRPLHVLTLADVISTLPPVKTHLRR